VTFRLAAPKAQEVLLRGTWMEGQESAKLAKDEKGTWSVTVGPLPPSTHSYSFVVDGVTIIDPRNSQIKRGSRGAGSSLLLVPGDPPAVWEIRKAPRGTVHVHWYESAAAGDVRSFHVYTPPGYESGRGTRFPVLYLLHGAGDTDREWVEVGRANIVLDNLIAEGKAKPMVVVMPYGHATPPATAMATPESRARATNLFEKDLLDSVMPLAEKTYRISARREDRAIMGLSMGGGQALNIGLRNLDRFSHIGVFSMGLRGEEFEKEHAKVLGDPEGTNKKIKLFWVGCGEKDFLWEAALKLDETLARHNIKHAFHKSEGGHIWMNWVIYLSQVAPLLFR